MAEIIGIKFRNNNKVYYFSPEGEKYTKGTRVIAETIKGVQVGTVTLENREVKSAPNNLKPILRIVTPHDEEVIKRNEKKEKEALKFCEERIAARNLKMKLIDVECMFDNKKLLFYFTADGRVDFRALVKDLAAVFRTRIELRQIGVRDEARMLGGIGICGREFCCRGCMSDFQPVSIKMAKEQGLSLNPSKISGACGRLMCCLKYEQNVYDELLKVTPKVGAIVTMKGTKGRVTDVNLITGRLKIEFEGKDVPEIVNKDDVKIIKDAQIKVDRSEMKALKNLEGND